MMKKGKVPFLKMQKSKNSDVRFLHFEFLQTLVLQKECGTFFSKVVFILLFIAIKSE